MSLLLLLAPLSQPHFVTLFHAKLFFDHELIVLQLGLLCHFFGHTVWVGLDTVVELEQNIEWVDEKK